ncbi:peptidyl-prolyl cis-trans isomerase [Spirochaetia bacterium]|nr:peptidyl-prolyl cis-trans isomerase [Spirochaetia bacterium]GHU32326.1 peptidyl-prolyl cis-trans isomerase [Spirochaetia bacterium]
MKKMCMLLLCAAMFISFSCKGNVSDSVSGTSSKSAEDRDGSYALGMAMASQYRNSGLEFDYDSLIQGFQEYYEGNPRFSNEEAMEKINALYQGILQKLIDKEQAFLEENKKKPGIHVTETGLQYEVLIEGTGKKPLPSETVRVHYEGTLSDGTVFDSSYDRGQPTEFQLSGVIPGWTEGVGLMNVGSTYRLFIPSELGYGERGQGDIPSYAPLIFKIELLDIVAPDNSGEN